MLGICVVTCNITKTSAINPQPQELSTLTSVPHNIKALRC